MGNSSSKKPPPVIATCNTPMYCIKKLGARHILIGGGGGAAKTGVANYIEEHLITFNKPMNSCHMKTKLTTAINTETYSTMNMDVICRLCSPERQHYILAAGHDEYCDIYETTDTFAKDENEPSFGLNFRKVARILTDQAHLDKEPYQKCVRFDRSTRGKKMLTGGSDGHVRIWDIEKLLDDRNPEVKRSALSEINAHPGFEVEDIDISPDGRYFFSIGKDNKVILWDLFTGKKMQDLLFPPELEKGYKVRSLRFVHQSGRDNNFFFTVAYNSIQRNKKSRCFLGLWAFHREKHNVYPVVLKPCYQGESISCLSVSPCGNFTGIGTLSGSIAIFDTHEMKPLHLAKETHGIFVTDVEFLDRVADDVFINSPEGNRRIPIPGPAADCRAALVSLSADNTVQVHRLPFEQSPSTTLFFLKLMIFSNIVYYILWTLAGF